jgi:hypothetical protein
VKRSSRITKRCVTFIKYKMSIESYNVNKQHYRSPSRSASLSITRIRFNTAKTALNALVHDSSASVLLGPELEPPPLTLPTSPIDDMPMLAESLIECPAILSLWILRDHQHGPRASVCRPTRFRHRPSRGRGPCRTRSVGAGSLAFPRAHN